MVLMAFLTSSLILSSCLHARFADAQDVALHLVEQGVDLAFVLVNRPTTSVQVWIIFRRMYFSRTMSR